MSKQIKSHNRSFFHSNNEELHKKLEFEVNARGSLQKKIVVGRLAKGDKFYIHLKVKRYRTIQIWSYKISNDMILALKYLNFRPLYHSNKHTYGHEEVYYKGGLRKQHSYFLSVYGYDDFIFKSFNFMIKHMKDIFYKELSFNINKSTTTVREINRFVQKMAGINLGNLDLCFTCDCNKEEEEFICTSLLNYIKFRFRPDTKIDLCIYKDIVSTNKNVLTNLCTKNQMTRKLYIDNYGSKYFCHFEDFQKTDFNVKLSFVYRFQFNEEFLLEAYLIFIDKLKILHDFMYKDASSYGWESNKFIPLLACITEMILIHRKTLKSITINIYHPYLVSVADDKQIENFRNAIDSIKVHEICTFDVKIGNSFCLRENK